MKKIIVLLLLSFVFNFAQAMPQLNNDVGVKTTTSIHKTKDNVVRNVFNYDINLVSITKSSTLKNHTTVDKNVNELIIAHYFFKSDPVVNYQLNLENRYRYVNNYFLKKATIIYTNKYIFKITVSSGGLPLIQNK